MTKTCSKCHTEKPTSEFHKRGTKWQPMCKVCKKERMAARYAEKGAEVRAINKRWREANPDKMKEARSAWVPPVGYHHAKSSIARAKKYGAEIGDFESILAFYAGRPAGYHVDHIKPLCKGGSHTVDNLQYLTATENLTKSSKWEEPND